MANRRYITAHEQVSIGYNEEQGHYIYRQEFDDLHNFQVADDLIENLTSEAAAIEQLKEFAAIDESESSREIEWLNERTYLAF